MQIQGLTYIRELVEAGEGFVAKCVFNRNGAIFFPARQEHRDQTMAGVSYADNYRGNALAAMVMPGRFEVRYHAAYSDADVAAMVAAMASEVGLGFLRNWAVTYQGRAISL